jgi:Glycosyl transferase family 2
LRRYLLISPCWNETQYLRRRLVAAQSAPPALWEVVDDGSTDDAPAILEEYARRLALPVRRTDRGGQQVEPGGTLSQGSIPLTIGPSPGMLVSSLFSRSGLPDSVVY